MARRVEVVLNRNARGLRDASSRSHSLARRLAVVAEGAGARLHTTSNMEELTRAMSGMPSRETDTVILAGGDGSCMAGLSALARVFGPDRMPRIAIAPAGTVGTIAKNLGLVGRGCAERVIASVASGTAREVEWPTLRVRDDGENERIGFIFGAGLVARFFEVYDAGPRKGLVRAAQIAAQVFAGSFVGSELARRVLEPVPCALAVDGEPHRGDAWSLVVASVLRDVGLHFLVTYRARDRSGAFHIVASGLAPRALGRQLPRVILGRPLQGEPHIDALAQRAVIDFADGGAAYVLDGDLFHARSVTVEMGPRISILLPG